MTRIAIIGASISGSATALALSKHKHLKIEVFERRKRSEVADKPCGNICTNEIDKYLKKLGLGSSKPFRLSEYREIEVFSAGKTAGFPTHEYEIDRKKLLDGMIGVAEMNGVKFHFGTELRAIEQDEKGCHISLFPEFSDKSFKGVRTFWHTADIVIGADGSNSKVASIIGKENKDFYMFLQTTVPTKDVRYKPMRPDKHEYKIFIGEEYGYYAYIFPSKNGKFMKIGLGDDYTQDVMKKFKSFLIYFGLGGIGTCDIRGALIPKPGSNPESYPIYLVGDASCNAKYTGGGIVPDMEQAFALADKIVYGNYWKSIALRKKMFINSRIAWVIENMFDKDCDRAIEIFRSLPGRSPEFKQIFLKRDNPKIGDMIKLINLRTVCFVAGILGNIMLGRKR